MNAKRMGVLASLAAYLDFVRSHDGFGSSMMSLLPAQEFQGLGVTIYPYRATSIS